MLVKLRKNESSENLIKRFIRKSKKEKIVDEYRERQYYKKPSELKREKHFHRLAELEKQKRKEKQERDD
ncbi:MAG: 30S ribosomal protein S21 [Flammeovirgaceae bacterium]|nr:30S ribosomal protein S21 [Flammeovirgaceae bacterium]